MSENKQVIAGRYELGKLVGSGGMAEVYIAQDAVLGRKVAIKVLNEDLANNKKFLARFKQEARSASSLTHPNIVKVLDAGEETVTAADGTEHVRAYMVMEYVEGLELSKLVARGPLKVPEAVRVAGEILSAVEFAHSAGIVHCDIKPDNIMITRQGNVKVLDFGIARAAAAAFDDLAQTTSVLGTAAYFSPEQAQGKKVDARTDIYAIGVVLFEMLTGKVPFEGDTAVAVAHQHIHAQPVAPSTFNTKVTPALDAVVLKALSKAPKDRYQSTQAFGTALQDAASGKVVVPETKPEPIEELLGPISEPALEKTDTSSNELPAEFAFLFGNDPQTAPTLVQPEEFRPEPKRVVAIVGIVALVFGAIAGMGLWVATLKPVNLFPTSTVTVPELKGETYEAAEKELKDLGLYPTKVEESSGLVKTGKVIRTEPGKETVIEPGALVQVFVSTGKTKVAIPDVSGLPLEEAKTTITDAGFKVGLVTESTSPTVAAGAVIATNPVLGTMRFQGAKVDISVSNGKIDIPDVRGKSVAEASNLLGDLNLFPVVQADMGCTKAAEPTVRSQSVPPGLSNQGVPITLSYCAG
ncbi:Stk1 family PASTA domain-containing Ser/Thr kinase [Aurantimicrobium minutum]|uniref:Stk1 family PASTA domain-containing Ser/Thr kinase n=1 Tax=Aurantimicrobium minutum TaxID=708131 RepID=UPI00247432AF|nr:Stk1 family PASTA domain-containing Ser/Thr kinase [Aurantimicrobium minutum]MDH6240199.1 serine/threonine protein kinase/beta-lactam-binding protein with PASTA domain [Aurantimicrobium minutum]